MLSRIEVELVQQFSGDGFLVGRRLTAPICLCRIETELSAVSVPSSGFLSRPAGAADGARQVDLLEEADMRQKMVSWPLATVVGNAFELGG